jgi:hypothetical protein
MKFRCYSNWANLRDSLSSKCQPELSARRASQNGFPEECRPGVFLHGEAATEVYLRIVPRGFSPGETSRTGGGDQPGKICLTGASQWSFVLRRASQGSFGFWRASQWGFVLRRPRQWSFGFWRASQWSFGLRRASQGSFGYWRASQGSSGLRRAACMTEGCKH